MATAEYMRGYYARNRERLAPIIAKRNATRLAAKPYLALVYSQNHRARTYGVRGQLEYTKFYRWMDAQEKVCRVCGAKDDLALDHIVPMRRGGENCIGNLQILCRVCNGRKG